MATTLPAPPAEVWPWLAQMGADRGGWYSIDLLDNGGRRSASAVAPEWQEIRVGDRLLTDRDGRTWFTVAQVEPGRSLVLRQRLDVARMRTLPDDRAVAARLRGQHVGVQARARPDGGTRLVVRGRGRPRPRALRLFDLLLWDPAHVLMQWTQFRNLRRRVEQAPPVRRSPERSFSRFETSATARASRGRLGAVGQSLEGAVAQRLAPARPAQADDDQRDAEADERDRRCATEQPEPASDGDQHAERADDGEAPVADEGGEEQRERSERADHRESGHGLRHEHQQGDGGHRETDPVGRGREVPSAHDVQPEPTHDPGHADRQDEGEALAVGGVVPEDDLGQVGREQPGAAPSGTSKSGVGRSASSASETTGVATAIAVIPLTM